MDVVNLRRGAVELCEGVLKSLKLREDTTRARDVAEPCGDVMEWRDDTTA